MPESQIPTGEPSNPHVGEAPSGAGQHRQVADEDLSGRQMGDFHLLRRFARGGMADVYLAEQSSLNRRVAVKVLRNDLAADETYIARFQAEAEAAARLNHPNIVQIYAVGRQDGTHYIAQEYVRGRNLRELLVRDGPPETTQAVRIMRQVNAALLHAAECGLVHRDIKPDNILLASGGEVKVADFGLARLSGDGRRVNLTQVGIAMGTPLYMSPEQLEGKPLDQRSDIYSAGVTYYHMLCGSPPFRGETALSIAVQHLRTQPEPLEELRPELPVGLCRLVHKMMAKNPADRYQSVREAGRELDRALADPENLLAAGETADSPTTGTDAAPRTIGLLGWMVRAFTRLPSARTKSRLRIVYVATLLVALAAGAALGWGQRGPDLLNDKTDRSVEVEKSRDVRRQLATAMLLDTEAAWRAVIEYWPEAELEVWRAKQRLALLYVLEGRYDEAGALFDELAGLDEQPHFRAFGLAGKLSLLDLTENDVDQQELEALLAQLAPLFPQLRRSYANRRIAALLAISLRKHRDSRRRDTRNRWNELLESLEQEVPVADGD